MNDATWMSNPNVRMAITVAIAALPCIIGDLSAGKVSWLTACVVIANCLTTAKAFMSDPNQGAVANPPVVNPPVVNPKQPPVSTGP